MIKKPIELIYGGSFEIKKGIIVTDPCYTFNNMSQVLMPEAKKGRWQSWINREDVEGIILTKETRNRKLFAAHESVEEIKNHHWFTIGTICVDSGEAGIYDMDYYRYNFDNPYRTDWWNKCSGIGTELDMKLVENGGITSGAGYGDGEYPVDIFRVNGEVVAVCVTFIDNLGLEGVAESWLR